MGATEGVSAFSHWGGQGSESESMGFVVRRGRRFASLKVERLDHDQRWERSKTKHQTARTTGSSSIV